MAGAARREPSALIAEIPAAEPAVGRWRQRLDVNAAAGIPAQVTVLSPFGGQFEEVLPHLTVGHQQPLADLRAAGEAIRTSLPVEGVVRSVSLWTQGDDERWRRAAAFALA